MADYFSIITRNVHGFDFTPPVQMPRGIPFDRHYENVRTELGKEFVDVVYRATELETICAARNATERAIGQMTK